MIRYVTRCGNPGSRGTSDRRPSYYSPETSMLFSSRLLPGQTPIRLQAFLCWAALFFRTYIVDPHSLICQYQFPKIMKPILVIGSKWHILVLTILGAMERDMSLIAHPPEQNA